MTTQPVADVAVNVTGTISSGRVPPNDLGAERAVLGSLMIDPAAVAEIRDILEPEDFYAERHAHIYRAAVALADRGDPIDEVTLQSQLERGPGLGRAVRSKLLSLREEDYAAAAQMMGAKPGRIIGRHLLPGFMSHLIASATLSIPSMILAETALSFLGLGIQPPRPSLGRMIFDSQGFVTMAWWMAVFPGATIFVIVLAFNLAGDGLRDVLDPKQRTMIEARSKQ